MSNQNNHASWRTNSGLKRPSVFSIPSSEPRETEFTSQFAQNTPLRIPDRDDTYKLTSQLDIIRFVSGDDELDTPEIQSALQNCGNGKDKDYPWCATWRDGKDWSIATDGKGNLQRFIDPETFLPLRRAKYSCGNEKHIIVVQQADGTTFCDGRPVVVRGGGGSTSLYLWDGQWVPGTHYHAYHISQYQPEVISAKVLRQIQKPSKKPKLIQNNTRTDVKPRERSSMKRQSSNISVSSSDDSDTPLKARRQSKKAKIESSASERKNVGLKETGGLSQTPNPKRESGSEIQNHHFTSSHVSPSSEPHLSGRNADLNLVQSLPGLTNSGINTADARPASYAQGKSHTPDEISREVVFVFKYTLQDETPYEQTFERGVSLRTLQIVANARKGPATKQSLFLQFGGEEELDGFLETPESAFQDILKAVRQTSTADLPRVVVVNNP